MEVLLRSSQRALNSIPVGTKERNLPSTAFSCRRSPLLQCCRLQRKLKIPQSSRDILKVVEKNPEDLEGILAKCSEHEMTLTGDLLEGLRDDWLVVWSDLGKSSGEKRPSKAQFVPSLKMLSFGALADVKVGITESFNRVKGSRYDLVQCFQVCECGTHGALILQGECASNPQHPSSRLDVKFSSVKISAHNDASPEVVVALRDKGLGDALDGPVPIKAPNTYIDIEYLDGDIRVHKGQSGSTYILRRLKGQEAIPYDLGDTVS
mmetsp:Transcript_41382/g.98111  ORF Transcript_41382/g.98111 Transcript_41382/m.98111 type:complete len:264 (+) Transcript_41382:94-885(+)